MPETGHSNSLWLPSKPHAVPVGDGTTNGAQETRCRVVECAVVYVRTCGSYDSTRDTT